MQYLLKITYIEDLKKKEEEGELKSRLENKKKINYNQNRIMEDENTQRFDKNAFETK